ncbi:hypothetical protein K6Y74_12440 [Burkholderia cenocepacia]|uniref:hypothetical protein n=1 Tax=Burkholderia cenocepacia TaxID=95486 RepID=UPI00222F2816|nr:hypothetical protein [Burkholderia cenocepacia]MCW3644043.1 hypothetical protein [Burkholderia cenocepacia]
MSKANLSPAQRTSAWAAGYNAPRIPARSIGSELRQALKKFRLQNAHKIFYAQRKDAFVSGWLAARCDERSEVEHA